MDYKLLNAAVQNYLKDGECAVSWAWFSMDTQDFQYFRIAKGQPENMEYVLEAKVVVDLYYTCMALRQGTVVTDHDGQSWMVDMFVFDNEADCQLRLDEALASLRYAATPVKQLPWWKRWFMAA